MFNVISPSRFNYLLNDSSSLRVIYFSSFHQDHLNFYTFSEFILSSHHFIFIYLKYTFYIIQIKNIKSIISKFLSFLDSMIVSVKREITQFPQLIIIGFSQWSLYISIFRGHLFFLARSHHLINPSLILNSINLFHVKILSCCILFTVGDYLHCKCWNSNCLNHSVMLVDVVYQ